MKKIASLISIIIMLSAVSGCKGSKSPTTNDVKDGVGVQSTIPQINFITWNEDYLPTLKSELPIFEAKSGIKVNWELLSEDVVREKVLVDLASGEGKYDIVLTDVWILPEHLSANYLEPLDRYVSGDKGFDISAWYNPFIEALTYDKKLYALPTESFGAALVYRKDLFDRYNVKVPTTIDELVAAAKRLTLDLDGDGKIDVYGVASRGKSGEEPAIIVSGFAHAYGGSWFEGGAVTQDEIKKRMAKPAFNSKEFYSGFKIYTDLLRNYGPPGSKDYTWYEIIEDGRKGRAAQILYCGFNVGALDRADIGMRDKYYAALPAKGPKGYVQEDFAMGFGINRNSKNKDAAWQFLKFITGESFMRGVMKNYATSIPMKSILESKEYREMHPYKAPSGRYVLEESLDLIDWRYMPHIPEYSVIASMLGKATSEVIAGKRDAKSALDELNRSATELMRRAGYYDQSQ